MKKSLLILCLVFAPTTMAAVVKSWAEADKKCESYGQAHNIPTSYYPIDGCVSITVSKRLY